MESNSMKMTLSIIHSAPVRYIVFTLCLILGAWVLKRLFKDLFSFRDYADSKKERTFV